MNFPTRRPNVLMCSTLIMYFICSAPYVCIHLHAAHSGKLQKTESQLANFLAFMQVKFIRYH